MLSRVVIRHFKGIVRELKLDLRNMTLLAGRNGLGKTTIFDAIDWCLFGNGARDPDELRALRNLYLPADPYVEITLRLDDKSHVIQRDPAGAQLDGVRVDDRDLLDAFVTDSGIFPPYTRDRSQRIRRLVYFPQDEIRALVAVEGREERAAILQAILGVPDAQLVMSSIRRVESRLVERRDSLSTSLAEKQSAIQELLLAAPGIHVATAPDIDRTLTYAREALGVKDQAALSMDELLRDIRDSQRSLVTEQRSLEDLRVTAADNASRQRSVAELLRQGELSLISQTRALVAAEETLRQATTAREIARSVYANQQTAADTVLKETDSLRRTAARLESADELRRSLMADSDALRRITAELSMVNSTVSDAEEAVSRASAQTHSRRAELTRLQDTMTQLQAIQEIASALTSAERRQTEVEAAIVAQAARTASLREGIAVSEAELQQLRGRLGTLELSRAERLNLLLGELEGLVLPIPTQHDCPLCGAPYHSHAQLVSEIRRAALLRATQSDEIEDLTNRLHAISASLAAKRAELASADTDLTTLEQTRGALEQDISTLSARLANKGDFPPRAVLESELSRIASELPSAELAEELAHRTLGDIRIRLRESETEAQRLRESIAAADSRLGSLGFSMSADLDQLRLDVQAKVAAAEAKYDVVAEETARVEQRMHETTTAERDAVQAVQSARMEVAAIEARVSEYRTSLQRLQAEYRTSTSRTLGVPLSDTVDIGAAVDQHLLRLKQRKDVLKAAEVHLDTLIMFLEQENRGKRLLDLRAEEGRLIQELEELDVAVNRFAAISRSLREAARNEGSKAVERLQGVVQYLFDAIYPHRHLNRVILQNEPAEVFLTDAQLSEAVRADLYTSIGQLSVLALCVFIGASLRQRAIGLNLLLLDEPVQSLDDLHFLGFITLVRRIALTRQVVMSTADSNVAELFRRQMKSSALGTDSGYVQYEWREFEAGVGPQIERVAG